VTHWAAQAVRSPDSTTISPQHANAADGRNRDFPSPLCNIVQAGEGSYLEYARPLHPEASKSDSPTA
jgi:hypothetical protein